ncbi:MAG: BrnA antitoxin family protein [bacterium]
MKKNYDFSKARRGAVLPPAGNKVRITIRLDKDIVAWFKAQVEARGGGNYQTLLNNALREYVKHQDEPLEKVLRRVLRQELRAAR